MKIIRNFIFLFIIGLFAWAYLQKDPDTWNEPPIPPALKSSFDQLRTWSKENAPQLQEEMDQLLQDMTQRAKENPELLQSAVNNGIEGRTTEATAAFEAPTALTLENLPKEDVIQAMVQKLKESKNFDLATRWEKLAQDIARMTGKQEKGVTETD